MICDAQGRTIYLGRFVGRAGFSSRLVVAPAACLVCLGIIGWPIFVQLCPALCISVFFLPFPNEYSLEN
jgi:hypothetical protein